MSGLANWEAAAIREQAAGYKMQVEPADLLLLYDCVKAADAVLAAGDCATPWTHFKINCSACAARADYRQARAKLEARLTPPV